ncbi:MAG: transposase [Burkholderiales bacterium]
MHLANTGAIKTYDGLKHGDDRSDARHLAHLLRLQLARSRTMHILAVENQFTRQTGGRMHSNEVKRLTAQAVAALELPADVSRGIAANVAVIQTLNAEIGKLEARLLEAVRADDQWALLKSVPGIGQALALVILLETGTISRFPGVGAFASYARCVDSVRLSNGRKKGAGNSKNGNKYLSWAFIEAAHFAARFSPQAKRFYERKRAKTNAAVAAKALAHKLARACYHILKSGQPFDAGRCFA